MLIDTHCHLEKKDYPNREEIIKHMENNIMIASADNLESSIEVDQLTKEYDNIYGTIGFHPNELEKFNDETFKKLENLLQNKKIVGIGEIGLDYHYGDEDKEKQKSAFIKQIELAIKYNLPIVIHSRDAAYDTLEILKKYPNIKFGIGGVLTFKNSKKLKEVVEYLDMSNILLETDSPYLSPEPLRGTKNEPYNVKFVAEFLANLKGLSLENIEKITSENAITQFDLNLKK